MRRPDPQPGVYRDISQATYLSWPHLNFSTLFPFKRSAAHARAEMLSPDESTREQGLGTAAHAAVLEPERFERDYMIVPADAPPRRSNKDKEWWAEFEAATASQEKLTQGEYETCLRLRDNAYANPMASALLSGPGANELCLVWDDQEFGVRMKAKIDRLSSAIVDMKSARDASSFAFARAAVTFGYAEQAAVYYDGAFTLSPLERESFLIALETSGEPYAVAVYQLDADVLRKGRANYRGWLKAYVQALASGRWPGYPNDLLRMPAYWFAGGREE